MSFITTHIAAAKEERQKSRKAPLFLPAGQTTQLIVGATPDPDLQILKLSETMYNRFRLRRIYYSAYIPVTSHPNLPKLDNPPLLREHRLYQADWLLRFYGFNAHELLDETHPNFAEEYDPKTDWALRNLHYFPMEINKADYEQLLRVPGIGVKSARRIVTARRVVSLGFDDLRRIGVVMKRAQYFITCRGRYQGQAAMEEHLLRPILAMTKLQTQPTDRGCQQPTLFPGLSEPDLVENSLSLITGEI